MDCGKKSYSILRMVHYFIPLLTFIHISATLQNPSDLFGTVKYRVESEAFGS